MLTKTPKHTPPLGVMLGDLGNPHPQQVARALGVGERTVRRWIAEDDAPRPVLLSLFWVTRWGAQWLDADLFNLAMAQMGLAQSLARELDALKGCTHPDEQTAPRLPQAPPMLYLVR